jgi:hypothetical protein
MMTTTFLPDLAMEVVEEMIHALEVGNVAEMSGMASCCHDVRRIIQEAQRAVEGKLSRGIEGRLFVARYDPLAAALEAWGKEVTRVVEQAKTRVLPEQTREFLSDFQGMGQDLANFQQFLVHVLDMARAPRRSIDWQRVKEAEAAYARGETKPFERASRGHGGE